MSCYLQLGLRRIWGSEYFKNWVCETPWSLEAQCSVLDQKIIILQQMWWVSEHEFSLLYGKHLFCWIWASQSSDCEYHFCDDTLHSLNLMMGASEMSVVQSITSRKTVSSEFLHRLQALTGPAIHARYS